MDQIADLNNHLTQLRKCREPKGLVRELAVDLLRRLLLIQ